MTTITFIVCHTQGILDMSKQLLTGVFLLFSLFFHTSASARLYKCVDEHGKVHYGDKPCVNKKRAYLDIVDSGATSGDKQSKQPAAKSGADTNSNTGNADVDSVLRARQAAMDDAKNNMDKKMKKSQQDYARKMERERQKNKRLSKADSNMRQKALQRDIKKAGLVTEKKNRMDNTLTQCQRFPDLEKCRTMHPQGVPAVNKAQRDEQNKVDQWHKEELNKIDKEYIENTRKDIKAYQQ